MVNRKKSSEIDYNCTLCNITQKRIFYPHPIVLDIGIVIVIDLI